MSPVLARIGFVILSTLPILAIADDNMLSPDELQLVENAQNRRIEAIEKVVGSVIAIYGEEKQGGGSGVIIDPSGIGLTNHHVIMGAGVTGWGGLADGKMYRWKLIGTDPGGDVAIIQMQGRDDFPYSTLGDSDRVKPGDWSLAMGNPFVLTEDQSPTVTLGIVSGVNRYQPGAGLNQLVYGNCIQTDSSINPGNSGGPLFNMKGEVVGINGRGSFKERGRVNVGLGYAISSNQIKNFIPELLATKLVEHGTLDANFEDRDGKVVCSNVYEDCDLYKQGVRPGDELMEFEGFTIETANQFTNLICTLPEDWPAHLKIRKNDGSQKTIFSRLYGLPYAKPKPDPPQPGERKKTPDEEEREKRNQEMARLLSARPGTVRHEKVNRIYADKFVSKWTEKNTIRADAEPQSWELRYQATEQNDEANSVRILLSSKGEYVVVVSRDDGDSTYYWNGHQTTRMINNKSRQLSKVETKLCPAAIQALGILAANGFGVYDTFGEALIDGSDRANRHASIRFRLVDDDKDPFFVWLSHTDVHSADEMELVKAGASLNCDQDPGGAVFEGWHASHGLRIPSMIKTVQNLSESVRQAFRLIKSSRLEYDETDFQVPPVKTELPGEQP